MSCPGRQGEARSVATSYGELRHGVAGKAWPVMVGAVRMFGRGEAGMACCDVARWDEDGSGPVSLVMAGEARSGWMGYVGAGFGVTRQGRLGK